MRCAYILWIFLLGWSVGMVEAAEPGVRRAPSTGPNQFQGRLPADALMCGPNALYMFLRAHDRPVLADSFFREVEPGDQGLSLAQLRDASTHYGVAAEIRRCTYEELVVGGTFPLVALLQPESDNAPQHVGHYVLVLDANSEGVSLIDGTSGKLSRHGRDWFCRNWKGYVVVPTEGRLSWLLMLAEIVAVWVLVGWLILRSNRSEPGTGCRKVLEGRTDASTLFAGPTVSK